MTKPDSPPTIGVYSNTRMVSRALTKGEKRMMEENHRYAQIKLAFDVLGQALAKYGPPELAENIVCILDDQEDQWIRAASIAASQRAFDDAVEHAAIIRAAVRAMLEAKE